MGKRDTSTCLVSVALVDAKAYHPIDKNGVNMPLDAGAYKAIRSVDVEYW